jgi:uncharacterized protein YecE (DUF72 family)
MATVRVGVSGWSYAHWRKGAFYPEGLAQRRELEHLSRQMPTVEINGSFYSLLRPQTYAGYRGQVPTGFVFAVKGGRFITHSKKLTDVQAPLANFLASGVLCLEETLGPLLWQLPRMRWEGERVERFLDLLPRDTAAAASLARKHDHRVRGRASTRVERSRPLRHALELRHPSHMTDGVVNACRRRNVALVFSHNGGEWPYLEEVTAGWCYLRLHGAPRTYASNYDDRALDRWAERIRLWADGREPAAAARITARKTPRRKARDVYVYFDNDQGAHAPRNALALAERLNSSWPRAHS